MLPENMTISDGINRVTRHVPAGAIYIVCAVPAVALLFGAFWGRLGVDPIRTLEHELGHWGLRLMIAALCVSPLRRWAGINLIKFRRALGLMAFFYVLLHLLVWLVLDMGLRLDLIWKDILKRPYITIGMFAFTLMLPLAVTSNNQSVKRMGAAAWKQLQKLVYPAALAAGVHFILVVKAWPPEPMVYLAIIVTLLGLRLIPPPRRVAG